MPIDRRQFLSLAGLSAGTLLLSACAGPSVSPADTGAASPANTAGPDFAGVTPADKITFWSSNPGSSQQVTQQIIDAFTKESGISVELVASGSYEDAAQKFQAAQAGGGLPDLITLSDVWWFRFFLTDQIIPLGSAIEAAGIDTSDYRPVFLGDYQYNGGQWALPWARSTPLFYYNKQHFADAGLPDRAPETWEELAEWAPALQAANGGVFAYEWPDVANYGGWTFQNVLWGFGGGWSAQDSFDITADSDESQQAAQFMQDSIYADKWAGQAAKDAGTDLVALGCSSTVLSSGSYSGLQKTLASAGNPFELGAGPLPGGPAAKTPVAPTGGTGVAIPQNIDAANQLAAAQFIAFLTNPENTVAFSAATGYIPVRQSADTTELVANAPIIGASIEQSSATRSQDYARVFLPGADQEMNSAIQNINTQQAPVGDTLTALRGTLEGIYDSQVQPYL